MTMDRELRSSKRQRVGATDVDVSVAHLESQEQVTDMQMDSANKGQNDDKKTPLEVSEETKRQMFGTENDVINVRASSKTKRSKGCNDGSSDLFPEHNEKLASTLLSLKETDIPAPQCESFPKAGNRRSLDSDASVATDNCLFAETCNEGSYDIQEMEQIEIQLLEKLKRYIDANGGPPIGDGWKVQATKKNKVMYKVYFSPDGKRFRSMREIARSVGITPKQKQLTGIEENLNSKKLEVNDARGSVCLKTDVAQMQQKTENLEVYQIHRGSVNKAKRSRRHQEVSASLVAVEDRTKQARLLHEAEIHPSSGLSTSELKEKNMTDIANSSSGGDCLKKREHMHWSELLEMVLKSSNMTARGIKNQILKALASEPPEWVKQKLQSSIATDVHDRSGAGPLKDVILAVLAEYRGKDPVKETFNEKSVDVQETGMPDERVVQNESRTKNACQKTSPPLEVITEHCRNVLQDVTSADKFAQLCNLIHGNLSRTHEVFDFRLIELRMNVGTYGMSPTLFDSDMQQIWKKVREVGQEMIHLADSLSDYSRASYKKQVATLLEEETNVNPEIDHINVALRACDNAAVTEKDILAEKPQETIDRSQSSKRNNKMTRILRVQTGHGSRISRKKVGDSKNKIVGGVEVKDTLGNGHPSSKEITSAQNIEVHMNGRLEHKQDGLPNGELDSSGNQVQCTLCSSNEHHERIIVCSRCQAAYHVYCLSPALETIPSTSWCCSCCSAVGKNSSEVLSLYDGKDRMVKEDMNNVVHSLVSEMHGGLLEMQNVQDGKLDTSSEQVQIENNMKECGAHAHSKVVGIEMDRENFCSHMDRSETTLHSSKQEPELHGEKELIAEVCKLCTTGTRDDDHLIQCSNENCLYKFYHLRCLRPPLASVPPPSWYCPSCLCRSCFMDENDACIVLCDGCDDAYHTYCLNPPLAEIPESNWYCPSCLEKQKKKKGKKFLNSTASAVKSTGRVRSKKATLVQNPTFLQLDKKANLSERTVGSTGHIRSKNSSKLSSPPCIQRGPHDMSDKIIKSEKEGFSQHEQSCQASQLTSYPPEEAGGAASDGSMDGATENFIVRVRPRHTTKYKTDIELKDAAKRKRKCTEPRRSEV